MEEDRRWDMKEDNLNLSKSSVLVMFKPVDPA